MGLYGVIEQRRGFCSPWCHCSQRSGVGVFLFVAITDSDRVAYIKSKFPRQFFLGDIAQENQSWDYSQNREER